MGLSVVKTNPPMTGVEWADTYFYLSPESSSIQGRWKTLGYQKAILNVMCNEDVGIFTWFKAARTGFTKLIVIAWAYFHQHKRRNTLIYQPTDQDAADFVKSEIDPTVRDVPLVRQIAKAFDKKSPMNTMSHKEFIGSVADIRGGKSARNYRRMSKDVVFFDELDGFDTDVEGEGSPISLGDVRVKNSPFKKSIRGSTPTVQGQSNIEISMQQADVTLRCYLACTLCGHQQHLRFGDAESKYGIKEIAVGKAGYMCESCNEIIPPEHKKEFLEDSIWGDAEKDVWTKDGILFTNKEGDQVSTPYHVGFKLWAAYSPFVTWSDILAEFKQAKQDVKTLKTFKNTTLGELWEQKGEAPELSSIKEWMGEYDEGTVQPCVQKITAGVDVQQDRLVVEVRGWCYRQTSYLIYEGELFGSTDHDDVWLQLDKLIDGGFDGKPVDLCLIDSGYRTEYVYDFCHRFGDNKYRPSKGLQTATQLVSPNKLNVTSKGKKYGINLWRLNTFDLKTYVHDRLSRPKESHGGWHLHRSTSDEYCKQLISETKIETKPGKFEWILHGPNHWFDTAVMNMAAAHILGVQHLRNIEEDDEEDNESSLADLGTQLNS